MHRYHNDHHSGVIAYLNGRDYIQVLFPPDKDGVKYIYQYDYKKPGKEHVDRMKAFAIKGAELTTYINQNIRENYHERAIADKVIIID